MNEKDTHLELIRRYLDGTATAEETQTLEALILRDPALRREFLRYAHLDAALAGNFRPTMIEGVLPSAPQTTQASAKPRSRWLQWRPLAAAAALAIGIFIWFTQSPAAVLVGMRGDVRVWRGQKTMKVVNGFALKAGDWLLTGGDGAAEVHFPGETTTLGIGANAEFGVVVAKPSKQLKLTAGTLTASVARQSASHPMMIRTPTAKAEVLGTKFEMHADKTATVMTVTEGRVLIAREDDESGVIVEATQSATVTATAPVSFTAPAPAESLNTALIAHWKFDGDGTDASRNGNDLTLGAGVIFNKGRNGKALDLHAAKTDVESPRIAFPPVFTISMWLHLNQGGARSQPLLGYDGQQAGMDDFWLSLPPTLPGSGVVLDVHGREMGSRAYAKRDVVRVERWHHLAVVADSTLGRATFYVDGRDVTEQGGLRRDFKLAGPLLIGRRVKGGPLPFDGQLDDLRIYGRALTAAELSALASENSEPK